MRWRPSRPGVALALMVLPVLLGGCRNSQRRYVLHGRIVSKESSARQLIIDNDDIPGFMPAMVMPYTVRDSSGFERVRPNDVIRADVVVEPDNKFWLEHIVVIATGVSGTASPGSAKVLMIGETVPDVPLVNQDGQTLRFGQFKGQAVLLTFIYTRCPFPDYCPRLSSQFASIQKELAKDPEVFDKTHLISISLDPSYDKAPVLRQYGLSYIGDDPAGFRHWDFVSTTAADLHTLASAFGVPYSEAGGQIVHGENTILLAADGTLAGMWPGNDWHTSQVLEAMKKTVSGGK